MQVLYDVNIVFIAEVSCFDRLFSCTAYTLKAMIDFGWCLELFTFPHNLHRLAGTSITLFRFVLQVCLAVWAVLKAYIKHT